MESVEFDPANPSEFEDFISEDERKQNNNMLLITAGILVLIIVTSIYTLSQQTKKFQEIQRGNLKKS